MKRVMRPVIEPDEPLDAAMGRIVRYGDALVKQQNDLLRKYPIGRNKMEGTKRLEKTGHDIALARRDTIHDVMAKNPALYQKLKAEFGK